MQAIMTDSITGPQYILREQPETLFCLNLIVLFLLPQLLTLDVLLTSVLNVTNVGIYI